jgi:hypothetical protein
MLEEGSDVALEGCPFFRISTELFSLVGASFETSRYSCALLYASDL